MWETLHSSKEGGSGVKQFLCLTLFIAVEVTQLLLQALALLLLDFLKLLG